VAARTVSINRAPVLTLWAAVVAERLGFDPDEALSLGRAVAGLNAQAKGRRIGVFKPHEEKPKTAREKDPGERFFVEVCGRDVPAVTTGDGIRAVAGGKPLEPEGVREYLGDKFGDDLTSVRAAMAELAKSYPRAELPQHAYPLYEQFRPAVPDGKRGWGASGVLDLSLIKRLKKSKTR
jgi:hypothetical protein